MGFDVTFNYIVKNSNKSYDDYLSKLHPGENFVLYKEGKRHYAIDSPLQLANSDWDIIGCCRITGQRIIRNSKGDDYQTLVEGQILFKYTKEESKILTSINKLQEKEISKALKRDSKSFYTEEQALILSELSSYVEKENSDGDLLSTAEALHLKNHGVTIVYPVQDGFKAQGFFVGDFISDMDYFFDGTNKNRTPVNGIFYSSSKKQFMTSIIHFEFETFQKTKKGLVFFKQDLIGY